MSELNKKTFLFLLISLFISCLSGYFIWLETSKYGVGVVMPYPQMAQTILDNGLGSIFASTQVTFPPLYQFTLAVLSKIFNWKIIDSARYLNVFLVVISSFIALVLYRKLTANLILLFIFGLCFAFSHPINFVFSYANSEPLFIFLLLLITFSIEKTNYRHLILTGFLSALAILTRYAGVAIVPSVCLCIFISNNDVREKIKKCCIYASIPTTTYFIYILRNYYLTQTFMGARFSSKAGFLSNTDRAFFSISSWFVGSYFFFLIPILLLSGAIVWNYKKEFLAFYTNTSSIIKFSFCFVVIYSLFIITSCTTTALEPLGDRFTSPVFLSILLILLSFLVFVIQQHKEKILIFTFILFLCICAILSFYKTIKEINFRKNDGAGDCSTTFWQENKLLQFVINNTDKSHHIFANNCLCTQIILKRYDNISYIPWKHKDPLSMESTGSNLNNILKKYPYFENSYIIWYESRSISDPNITFSIKELSKICKIEKVIQTDEGTLYKVIKCSKSNENK